MAVATFDTLKIANDLKAGDLSPKQAEAVATAISQALQVNFKELATKDDLKMLEVSLKGEFAGLRGEFIGLKGEFTGLKAETNSLSIQINHLKWAFGLLIGVGFSVTLTLLGFMFRQMVLHGSPGMQP